MEAKKETLSATKVKLAIELTAKELKPFIDKTYQELGSNLTIPGFRKGKAPNYMVEKEIGSDRFYQEVLEKVIPHAYYESLIKEKLMSVSQPEINVTKFAPTDGITFEATLEIIPEFDLPDYKVMKISKTAVKVTEKEIEEMLKSLRERQSTFNEVTRAAKKGDRVEIDFEGTKKGILVEGTQSKNHPVVLGNGMFLPDFEESLLGMSKGEEKTFDVKFPEDYHAKHLAGETVNFKAKMITVSEKVLPELNDQFAKDFAGFANLEDLKKSVRENIEKTKEIEEQRRLEEEIMNTISAKVKLELPEGLVHQEIHKLLHEAEDNLRMSGLTLEKYLESTGKTHDQLEEELKPEADKRVRFGLILSKITEAEGIKVTKADVEAEKEKIIGSSGENKSEVEKRVNEHEFEHQIENVLAARKTIDKLIGYIAK